jgi:hypothetical protein
VAPRKPTILVVTEDPEPFQAIAAWLREAGLRVIGCPGPQPPSYVSAGRRGESCPLAAGADVVVLDLWLASDTTLRGTPAMHLLSYYLDLGKPVVALQRLGGPPGPFVEGGTELVPWPPTQRALLGAVFRRLPGVASARQGRVRTVNASPWSGGQAIGSPA